MPADFDLTFAEPSDPDDEDYSLAAFEEMVREANNQESEWDQ